MGPVSAASQMTISPGANFFSLPEIGSAAVNGRMTLYSCFMARNSACPEARLSYFELGPGSLGGGGIVSTSAFPLPVKELRLFCSQIYSSIVQFR